MPASFQGLVRRVRRRLHLRRALAEAMGALAFWTLGTAAALAAARLGLGSVGVALACVLGATGLVHGFLRATRVRPSERDAGIWIDRTLGLPETAATAVEVMHAPSPSLFREPLVRCAREQTEPRRAELLSFGPPPASFDLFLGALVFALAIALLPEGTAEERRRLEPPGAGGDDRGATAASLPGEDALLRARLEQAREALARGESEALVAARLARIERDLLSPEARADDGARTGEDSLEARLRALADRLGPSPEVTAPAGGPGSAPEAVMAAPADPTPSLRDLNASAKQQALRSRPDWPREMDALVERYFAR